MATDATRATLPQTREPTVDVLASLGIIRMMPDGSGTYGRSAAQMDWSPSDPDTGETGEMGIQLHTPLVTGYSLRADSSTAEGRLALAAQQVDIVAIIAGWVLAAVGSDENAGDLAVSIAGAGNTLDHAIESAAVALRSDMLDWWDAQESPTVEALCSEFGWRPSGEHPFT